MLFHHHAYPESRPGQYSLTRSVAGYFGDKPSNQWQCHSDTLTT